MIGHLSTGQFLAAWAIAAVAAAGVFTHADKRGSRHATAWGVCVFLFLAIALPVYVIHVAVQRRA